MRLQLTHNMKDEVKALGRLETKTRETVESAMRKGMHAVAIISASEYLQGPRPKRLGIKSGDLIRAIMGGYSFSERTSGMSAPMDRGSNESIRVVFRSGDKVVGLMGVEEFKPFDYPYFWEQVGRGGSDKRPFLGPAGRQAKSRGVLDKIFQDAMDTLEHD